MDQTREGTQSWSRAPEGTSETRTGDRRNDKDSVRSVRDTHGRRNLRQPMISGRGGKKVPKQVYGRRVTVNRTV